MGRLVSRCLITQKTLNIRAIFGEIAVPEQMSILHHPPDELEDDRFHSAIRGLRPRRCYASGRC